ncbi:MAG: sigma-54 dependent transcriptional regulator [Candidatus Eisenbacteria bacterium]
MLIRLMLAIRDQEERRRFSRIARRAEALVSVPPTTKPIWDHLAAEPYDLVVIERELLPDPETESVAAIRELPERPEVVIVGEERDAEETAHLLGAGSLAVLSPSLPDSALREVITSIVRRRREEGHRRFGADSPLPRRNRLTDFVSASPAMLRLMEIARRVSSTDTSLLLLGETGVGKEWLARAIHEEGPRAMGPFVAVNCGAIPETLLESELFGHEEGAFTGAHKARRGHFEMAHEGTLFLDEIGEMPSHVQVKLLRVLQEKRIQRIGSEREIGIDVRVMAATNRNIDEEIEAERFRKDLFYRLGVVTLTLPPLRQRREDIPDLVRGYMDIYEIKLGREISGIAAEAMDALVAYDWPGNVRELINVIERAVLLCPADRIALSDLPEAIAGPSPPGGSTGRPAHAPPGPAAGSVDWEGHTLRDAKREVTVEFERAYLTDLLRRAEGRIGLTAKRAGITPRALHAKMRALGLRKEDFRSGERP